MSRVPPHPFNTDWTDKKNNRINDTICVFVFSFWTQGPVHGPVWRSVLRHGGEESLSDCDARKEHHGPGDGLPHRRFSNAVRDSVSKRWALLRTGSVPPASESCGGSLKWRRRVFFNWFFSSFPRLSGAVCRGDPPREGFSVNRPRPDWVFILLSKYIVQLEYFWNSSKNISILDYTLLHYIKTRWTKDTADLEWIGQKSNLSWLIHEQKRKDT